MSRPVIEPIPVPGESLIEYEEQYRAWSLKALDLIHPDGTFKTPTKDEDIN